MRLEESTAGEEGRSTLHMGPLRVMRRKVTFIRSARSPGGLEQKSGDLIPALQGHSSYCCPYRAAGAHLQGWAVLPQQRKQSTSTLSNMVTTSHMDH
jgi:hypothetical protein